MREVKEYRKMLREQRRKEKDIKRARETQSNQNHMLIEDSY